MLNVLTRYIIIIQGINMDSKRLGIVESKFADIVWANEPLTSRELVELSLKELGWKKSTTYTVLKKLSDRGIFQNNDGVVTSLISKEELYSMQSEEFVNEAFQGSLPAFIAAFTARKGLSEQEIDQIRKLIDSCGKE